MALLLIITACNITGNITTPIIHENNRQTTEVYFCQKQNCETKLIEEINNATDIKCALYSLKSEPIKTALANKKAKIIIEGENSRNFEGIAAKKEQKNGLMHNKFCIINTEKTITGSWNPATKTKTANNMIIIPSKNIAQNYNKEFEEMQSGIFQAGQQTETQKIILNSRLIENYFCPEDNCRQKVINALEKAQENIYFMTYSFTDSKIGDTILEKAKTLQIKGIFDSTQISEWSQYKKLKEYSKAKKQVHHKVFIIDNQTVITGSYNPTGNGNNNNDENLLIIHDPNIAAQYLQEFNSINELE